MTRAEKAMDLFRQGYNCAQAVACAYTDLLGLDQDTTARMVSSFGGGFGQMREVCGTVSGMGFVLGALQGYHDPKDNAAKSAHFARVQKLARAFAQENGSIVCRELLGLGQKADGQSGETLRRKRPCVELVGYAAELLEHHLKEEGML